MKRQQIQINTFTPIYDELEDRIRLIINYKQLDNRVDLMITRAFIVRLISFIEEFLLNNFSQEVAQNDSKDDDNCKTPTESSHIDLIVKEELLQEVKLSFIKENQTISIVFAGKNIDAIAVVDKKILNLFLESLKKSIPKYSWGLYL